MSVSRPSPQLPLPAPWVGVNYWSRRGGPLMWRQYDDSIVREELATLVDHGLTVTRSFLYWPDFQPAPDRIDEQYVERYHQFLRACQDLGIGTIPTFIVGHMSGQNWDVAWRNGRDLYADGFMLGQQAFFIREMVRRFGSAPAVQGWLISNEMPLYGGPTTREHARAWGLICAQAVRAGGSDLPVSLGDGAWTMEVTGADNGFRLADQHDVVDFVGPHSYPMGDDQLRQFVRAAFVSELCHVGKPVVLEEFGVTSAFVSDENAADYYRQVLHHSLLAGATGWIGWNNTDFDLADTDPYRHHLYELNFGLTAADGTPKPALAELAAFAGVLEAVDVARCRRATTGTAILVPSYLDTDHPMIDDVERTIIPEITLHAYLAAKRADLAPALLRESTWLDAAGQAEAAELLLVPSAKALTGPMFPELVRRAEAGATVYVGWFAGAGSGQRGAWWPNLEPIFGVRHRLRYGLNELCDTDIVEVTAVTDLGDLKSGATLRLRPAGPPATRAYLPVDVTDAEVVLADQAGRPVLVRRRIGSGALYLGTLPVEYFGAVRPDAHPDDEVWRLYRALAAEAGVRPAVRVDSPAVTTDYLVHEDGTRFVWLISLAPEPLSIVPDAPGRLTDVLTGEDVTERCDLPAYGVRVARLEE
ncbi:cellulase family glycosylhydrolase [Cryptosporangium aurantiacum]|uniref:Cellulase (Glycosyl hydrolase family 5) n=1 Tax=Cryptosporangium aurantiacum TaxID=134849 RepID=A0A1M7R1C6_9ACTN|nr:cellulase family glycosylhydrolase [Cryptosporangium aurantiacum]SHN38614.1 Cellulase (glycosyl hydrolase family 5) [Cryptosporangium aurantiacum]